MTNLAILTAEPSKITDGKELVSYERKSTDKNPVPETEKFRGVEVQPYSFAVVADPDSATAVFAEAIREKFSEAAGLILKDFCLSNPKATEINDELLTFKAVIDKLGEMQTSQRLNGKQIEAWYDASKSKTDAVTRYTDSEKGKKQQASLRTRYLSLASNNPGIDATLAVKMLGYINPDDTSNPVCRAVAKRLERLSKVDSADDL